MARPTKQGLDYFPLDVDFFTDPKFVRLRVKFGAISELLALRIFSEIYKNGYYIQYSENLQFALAESLRIDIDQIDTIVIEMANCGLFDSETFNNHKVLTSCRIQQTWLSVAERRKEKDTSVFWLLEPEKDEKTVNVDNNEVNVCNNPTEPVVNADDNEQSKDKDKVNEKICNASSLTIASDDEHLPPIHSSRDALNFYIRKFGNKNTLPFINLAKDYGYMAAAEAADKTPLNVGSPISYMSRILEMEYDYEECN